MEGHQSEVQRNSDIEKTSREQIGDVDIFEWNAYFQRNSNAIMRPD